MANWSQEMLIKPFLIASLTVPSSPYKLLQSVICRWHCISSRIPTEFAVWKAAGFMKTFGQFRKLKGALCSDIKQRIICKLGRGPIIYYVSPCSPYFRSTVQQKSQFNGNFNQSQNFSELTCGVIGWNICGRSEFPSNWLSCTYCARVRVHVCTCARVQSNVL